MTSSNLEIVVASSSPEPATAAPSISSNDDSLVSSLFVDASTKKRIKVSALIILDFKG